jgi:hypothetical protein
MLIRTCIVVSLFYGMLAGNAFAQELFTANTQGNTSNSVTRMEAYLWEFHELKNAGIQAPECTEVDTSVFGKEAACLKALADARFIEKEEVVPGDPNLRTIVLKPDIYKAVRSIDKYLRKVSRDQSMDGQLIEDYTYVMRVALAVVYASNTEEFEKELSRERKNPQNQIALFRKVKLL